MTINWLFYFALINANDPASGKWEARAVAHIELVLLLVFR